MAINPSKGKLRRLESGNAPRVLDLFAGCGGLSLGFHAAGFQITGAVEVDPFPAKSHALNFFKGTAAARQEIHAQPRDIRRVEPERLVAELGLGDRVAMAVDVIVGGPPCQAFARVGRAKLREVAVHPQAFRQDARANLYLRYLHYVKVLQPLALLVENVPDTLNYGGHNIAQEMCEALSEMGYVCGYTLLNAAYYGVPQMRERMFLIAYAEELDPQRAVRPSLRRLAPVAAGCSTSNDTRHTASACQQPGRTRCWRSGIGASGWPGQSGPRRPLRSTVPPWKSRSRHDRRHAGRRRTPRNRSTPIRSIAPASRWACWRSALTSDEYLNVVLRLL